VKHKEMFEIINGMDKTSDEFYRLFSIVNEKYFDFDKPDEYQSAAKVLNLILHRGEDWMVEMLAKLGEQLYEMVENKTPAVHGSFQVKESEIFFDFYTNKDALASVHKMLRNSVLMQVRK
jgi:hypothetical protein